MRQRGRKSVANLMTLRVDGEPARLQPPRGLSKAEQHQFNDLINATSPKHFAESDLPLLVTYVQATVMARSAIRKNCRLGKGDARAGGAGDEIAAGTAVAVRCQNDGAADAADTVGAAAVGALTMPRQRSTGERYVMWIESYCVRPVAGPERGQRVKLTDAQKETVRRIYDQGDNLEVIGPLAAYLALLHVCGPEAVRPMTQPGRFTTDVFTAWAATGPRLKEVLRREGERIVCPQLGTRYPTAA